MQFDLPFDPPSQTIAISFETPKAFDTALSGWQGKGTNGDMRAAAIETPLGTMVAAADHTHLHLLEFADRPELPREIKDLAARLGRITPGKTAITVALQRQLDSFFKSTLAAFTIPIKLHGSDFATDVWTRLQDIPMGQTQTYGALADDMGRPTATRAVARANGANRLAIVVPCHRVIGADGTLTGYAGGLWRKERLIALERAACAKT